MMMLISLSLLCSSVLSCELLLFWRWPSSPNCILQTLIVQTCTQLDHVCFVSEMALAAPPLDFPSHPRSLSIFLFVASPVHSAIFGTSLLALKSGWHALWRSKQSVNRLQIRTSSSQMTVCKFLIPELDIFPLFFSFGRFALTLPFPKRSAQGQRL